MGASTPTDATELFVPRPEGVPADLTAPTAAYRRQTWLAFGGLLLFVALYLGLTGYLGWVVWRLLYDAFTGGNAVLGIVLSIPPLFFLAFLVPGLFVVKHQADPTQVQITAETQPELFAFVNRIADEAGAPRPHKVFVTARVNAAVFYDLSFRNLLFPTRKNLEIGLGLVEGLTLDELKAVIAHEFGHFAQRTMAVGRWVYVSHQIAGHVIVHRGWIDNLLRGLSYTDIRIAWIGWILRLLVWSIRAVFDTAFRLIVLAHRALSREMELQADLVAVSVSGSDSLIHALHRLGPVDDAWDAAVRFSNTEIDKKRPPEDLFSIQARVLEHLRRVFDDETFGEVPERPRAAREAHRVFEEALAQPPRMWSTHPPNREREDNAKRRYIPSSLDERPAWSLFRDAASLRREVTKRFYDAGGPKPVEDPSVPIEETLERVDEDYRRPSLDRRYRGAYLGRTIVGNAAKVRDLYCKVPEVGREAILRGIDGLYPESLKEELERMLDLRQEKSLLEALQDGVLDAPGGVIRYRGREIPRKQLADVVEGVKAEHAAAEAKIIEHDRRVRSLHRAAAREVSPAWDAYRSSLVQLMHWADHVSANVRDAHGYLMHAVNIVLADGHVSASERRWLVSAANDLYGALEDIYRDREWVSVPERVEEEGGDLWGELLERSFGLLPPHEQNIGDWLNIIDGWVFLTCLPLEKAVATSLELLLEAEDHVATCLRDETEPGPAPPSASVPDRYVSFVEGAHRERQKRLGWWDRFVTADGFVPGLLRLVVASAVLVPALALGSMALGDSTVHVYNGLAIPVEVSIGDREIRVGARDSVEVSIPSTDDVRITTRTSDGREVESFDAEVEHGWAHYAYNVAGAAPLVTWQAMYDVAGGGNSEETSIGAPRWLQTDADAIFRDPPSSVSVSSRSSRATRDVLTGVGDVPASVALGYVEDEAQRRAMIRAHLRFDPSSDRHLAEWVESLGGDPELAELVAERATASPNDTFWLSLEHDIASDEAAREAVCARHRARLAEDPSAVALQYAVTRCIPDAEARGARWRELAAAHPTDPWIAVAAGYDHARHGRWEEALAGMGRGRDPAMGAAWPSIALELARVRRVLLIDPRGVQLTDLAAASPLLQTFLVFDGGPAPSPEVEAMVRP
ncbi:MAG: M48 family metalloprotease, partial [Myxococcales bacterium]|nr:M48 family metalloprotease [Myxococcales bacterium]